MKYGIVFESSRGLAMWPNVHEDRQTAKMWADEMNLIHNNDACRVVAIMDTDVEYICYMKGMEAAKSRGGYYPDPRD